MNAQIFNIGMALTIYLINHRHDLKRKLPHLIIGTLIVGLIYSFFVKDLNTDRFIAGLGIFCWLDLIYVMLTRKKKTV